MALSNTQVRQLRAKLEPKYVKTRKADGADLHYVEGWHVIAEANRIFGYDAWDRRTLATRCVWNDVIGQLHAAAYTARVRVSIRAGDVTIVREGSGSSEAKAPTPGQAHELALKGAETDATKRALATFGNPFGLALYDREQIGVRKPRGGNARPAIGPWILRSPSGAEDASFDQPSEFASALRQAMSGARDIELLFAIWEQNVDAVRALNRSLKQEALPRSGIAPQLVAHLKHCAVALTKPETGNKEQTATSYQPARSGVGAKIDKSMLTISEPKRIRSKEHLRYVARQPCLICGRAPSHAHHIRFAQSRGLGLKVSDEFTVPLCAIHHQQNHATGNERLWWQEHKIDPLDVASHLWRESQRLPAPQGK
jgi:DNA recombination protein Rad52